MHGEVSIHGLTPNQVRRRLELATGDIRRRVSFFRVSRLRQVTELSPGILGSFSGDRFELWINEADSFVHLDGMVRTDGERIKLLWTTHCGWTGWALLVGGVVAMMVTAVWTYTVPWPDDGLFATFWVSMMFAIFIGAWYAAKSRRQVALVGFIEKMFSDVTDERAAIVPTNRTL